MATRNPTSSSTGQVVDQSLSRYDILLALMPVPLVAGIVAASLSSLPTVSGIGLGSLLSLPLLVYGLFFDSPTA
jgi:hypothetical protein